LFALVVALAGAVAPACMASDTIEQILQKLRPISLNETQLRELAGKDGFKPYLLNPVIAPGMASMDEWDAGAIGTACVIKVDGVYHLYYEAWGELTDGGKKEEYDTLQIGHAVSLDGVHWAKDPANPVLRRGETGEWDMHGTWDPFVIHEDGKFKMWYGGSKGDKCEWAYAESKDGTHFQEHGPISQLGGVEDIHVVHDPDSTEYRLYYWDRAKAPWDDVMKGPPAPSGLFVATSKDETHFDFANAKRLTVAGQPWPSKYSHVIRQGDGWAMIFGEAVVRGKPSRTGLAFSKDGFDWEKSAFPIVVGHDAEAIEAAPNLWLIYYGPNGYFDMPECDVRLAIYDGTLEDLTDTPE
jgi:hypothetical protein